MIDRNHIYIHCILYIYCFISLYIHITNNKHYITLLLNQQWITHPNMTCYDLISCGDHRYFCLQLSSSEVITLSLWRSRTRSTSLMTCRQGGRKRRCVTDLTYAADICLISVVHANNIVDPYLPYVTVVATKRIEHRFHDGSGILTIFTWYFHAFPGF